MSYSRLEKFIYAICSMDVSDLPVPLSRIEKLWNCLITGETPDFEPLSRNEKYLMAMLDRYDISNLPAPMSRGEKLLYKIAVGETDLSDVPGYLSRYEELLKYLIENGEISEDDFEYVLYTLNQSLYTLYTTAEKPVKKAIIYGDTLVNTLQESSSLAVTPMGEAIDAQQATFMGTANGVIKSAILKGQTLVNLDSKSTILAYCQNDSSTQTQDDNHVTVTVPKLSIEQSNSVIRHTMPYKFMSGKTYTVISDKECVPIDLIYNSEAGGRITQPRSYKSTFIAPIDMDYVDVYYVKLGSVGGSVTYKFPKNIVILEGDYTNVDIPYFEGMQSVKMPVLTTTGKNIFSPTKMNINDGALYGYYKVKDDEGVKYTLSLTDKDPSIKLGEVYFGASKVGKTGDGGLNWLISNGVVVFPTTSSITTNLNYISIYPNNIETLNKITKRFNIQIEFSEEKTTYEPYKSNILSTPSDLELRGIGEVQDELDLLSGELTERIGEIVLDGSEEWTPYPGYVGEGNSSFVTTITSLNNKHNDNVNGIINDKFISGSWFDYANNQNLEMVWSNNPNQIGIRVKSEKASDVDGIKAFLSANNIKINYELATPVVKTIDLTIQDQDVNTVPHLQAFNETTHISTSSTGLIPNVVIPATVSYPSIIKPSTLYTVKLKRSVASGTLMINVGGTEQAVTSDCFTLTTPSTLTSQDVVFSGKGNVISEVTVVESNQTAKEYGYFEGMQSVKTPVLTTTGKNLFDLKEALDRTDTNYTVIDDSYDFKVSIKHFCSKIFEPTTTGQLTLSYEALCKDVTNFRMGIVYKDGTHEHPSYVSSTTQYEKRIIASNINKEVDYIRMDYTTEGNVLLRHVQIEEGSVATEYEPYKSNILSTPEDVTLRGIGEVQDTLNCLTGEVTERIGEIVLNGSEDWIIHSLAVNNKVITFYGRMISDAKVIPNVVNYTSDKIASLRNELWISDEVEGFMFMNDKQLAIKIKRETASTSEELVTYLSQNPITIQYELVTPTVKTVDLSVVDQDNQPTELGTFEDVTRVSLEAENLIPEVKMEVATHISEELVSASPLMDDISTKQEHLNTTIDEQSNNVDATMIATTEIFEETL